MEYRRGTLGFSNWCPTKVACEGTESSGGSTVTIGAGVSITYAGIKIEAKPYSWTWEAPSSSYTYNGFLVACSNGNGNCWNGEPCSPA